MKTFRMIPNILRSSFQLHLRFSEEFIPHKFKYIKILEKMTQTLHFGNRDDWKVIPSSKEERKITGGTIGSSWLELIKFNEFASNLVIYYTTTENSKKSLKPEVPFWCNSHIKWSMVSILAQKENMG